MLTSNAERAPLLRPVDVASVIPSEAGRKVASTSVGVSAWSSQSLADVAPVWRALSSCGVESPGQSLDFVRLWVEERQLRADEQCYVVGLLDGQPVALLPLHRQRRQGLTVYTWFAGSQVGCNAPIADLERLAELSPQKRTALWRAMVSQLGRGDLLYLPFMPDVDAGQGNLFAQLGVQEPAETLYRSVFSSWGECDREQRSRSRRKHDRQQGDRLAALGVVDFEEVRDPVEAEKALDVMFRQRSARFRAQGIRDVFVAEDLTSFYHAATRSGSPIDVRLHVLRLDGEIVAVRYNIVEGDRMFCLISSMSDDPRIQSGSPGKQCLLRVMQSVFEQRFTTFDMGAGFTDEKRHWCNVQIPLRHHYVSLSWKGTLVTRAHRGFQSIRARAKASPNIKKALRTLNQWRNRNVAPPASDQL